MSWNARIFDIFPSCPGDITNERDLVSRVVQDWNLNRGRSVGAFFSILTWENLVSSKMSDRPQKVINDKIGDEYDIYLGMMWGRFGNPTGEADSGTVEEFDRALDRYRSGEQIRLAMLFKTANIPFKDIDGDQIRKVQEFKKRYSDQGGLYREYDSEESLIRLVNALLEDFLTSSGSGTRITTEISEIRISDGKLEDQEQDELGIFDVNDQIALVVERQVRFLTNLNEINGKNTQLTSESAEKISSLASINQATQQNIQPIISKLPDSMDSLSSYIESNIKSYMDDNDSMANLSEAALDISRDFSGSDRGELCNTIESTAELLLSNADSNLGLIKTLESNPRTDKKMNKSKRRLIRNFKLIESSTRSTSDKMKLALRNFQ